MALSNQAAVLAGLGRREEALAAVEEACRRMIDRLERQPFELPDCGLRLLQQYLRSNDDIDRPPDQQLVERHVALLRANSII